MFDFSDPLFCVKYFLSANLVQIYPHFIYPHYKLTKIISDEASLAEQ